VRFVTVPRRIYAPPVLRSLFGARDFILTWKTGVNRPVAVVEFWRIAGAAAAKETAEERDQRYLYRVHRLRSRLLNVLELPRLVIDALEGGNQTDRQIPQDRFHANRHLFEAPAPGLRPGVDPVHQPAPI